jgi:hypothetical protein
MAKTDSLLNVGRYQSIENVLVAPWRVPDRKKRKSPLTSILRLPESHGQAAQKHSWIGEKCT